MPVAATSAPGLKSGDTLESLRARAAHCTACPLYKNASRTVFGEGSASARVVLVGEQPGDKEDLAGHPFVGPAGKLLDRALAEAGINRSDVYVTNAVKHFKFKPTDRKRRLHQKPGSREIAACRPWLEAELSLLAPDLVVALGATAAQSLMGSAFRVTRDRGRLFPAAWARGFIATVHPSSILRAPDEASRHDQYQAFVADLKHAATEIARQRPSRR
ncbi:MAG TPA: UdgX family uracil-DNA binding protein [Opitutaceae bacterium]|nr:UdgX family uracil-DNA binding protein [Opitutaceae bacterium]